MNPPLNTTGRGDDDYIKDMLGVIYELLATEDTGIDKDFFLNETYFKSHILDLVERREREAKDKLVKWIETEAPITNIQGIEPLSDGQYVKVKNLMDYLASQSLDREEKV